MFTYHKKSRAFQSFVKMLGKLRVAIDGFHFIRDKIRHLLTRQEYNSNWHDFNPVRLSDYNGLYRPIVNFYQLPSKGCFSQQKNHLKSKILTETNISEEIRNTYSCHGFAVSQVLFVILYIDLLKIFRQIMSRGQKVR